MIAAIKDIAVFLPPDIISNEEIETKIIYKGLAIRTGFLRRLLGSDTRHFAADGTQVSDLASQAGRQIMDANPETKIDLLIFAAASSDLTEPATANIIQYKLGLNCPVLDIKNACNSFVSAIHTASAFILSGIYRHILIVGGEKLSEVINYHPGDYEHLLRCLSGYGLGDGGAAMLMGPGSDRKLIYQKFCTWGEYWNLCTVEGGGSMAYRDLEKFYFEGDSRRLRDVFLTRGAVFFSECMQESGWKPEDIDCVVAHQVSAGSTALIAQKMGISAGKFVNTFSKYGNTAAVTIPLALHEAVTTGKLKKGDRLLLLGLAAGVSISVQLIEW